jgi:hypothetical protein
MPQFTGEFVVDRVKVADLLERIEINRDAHKAAFETAWEGYKRLMEGELQDRLDKVKKGMAIDPFLRHQAPQDHTSEYDEVIGMLKLSQNVETPLTQTQYRWYIADDWGWKNEWTTSNAAYTAAAGR